MSGRNVAVVVTIEWPADNPGDDLPAQAFDWLKQIVNTGLAEDNDNRGAFIDETASTGGRVGRLWIKGIEAPL